MFETHTCPPVVMPHLGWFSSLRLPSLLVVTATAGRPGMERGGNKGTRCLSKVVEVKQLRRGAKRGRRSWKARRASPPATATTTGL